MAIDPSNEYPTQIDTTDPAGYPYGKAQNISAPGDGLGTPWEKRLVNDFFGLLQSLLSSAAIVPSGTPDKVGASQYLQALQALFNGLVTGTSGNLVTIDTPNGLVDSGVSLQDILTSLTPQGNWDADTNTPDIAAVATTGDFWIVSVAGSTNLGGITDWQVNDWAVKTAAGWAKVDNTANVTSVFGRLGAVVATLNDYDASLVNNDSSVAGATVKDALDNLGGGALNINGLIHVRDEKSQNTAAQTLTLAGGWQTRDMNTIHYNGVGGSPLSGNQVTLADGTWILRAKAGAYTVGDNRLRLYNITDGVTVDIGLNNADTNANETSPSATLDTKPFVVSGGPKVFEIQHIVAADGFGGNINNFSGLNEVYLTAEFWKVG